MREEIGWQAKAPNATYFSQNLESGKNCGAGWQGYPLGPAGWQPARNRPYTGAQRAPVENRFLGCKPAPHSAPEIRRGTRR
jgi:hypothetical protein